ncbi:hypothetical protein Q9189_007803 [Teloschistes chrysophthalmus]
MASSSAMEGQHPSATHPSHSENDPSLGPAKTPSTSASTKRSHSKPSFQFHTGISAVGANKDNRHPATTARLADHLHQHASRGHHGPTPNPTHAPLDRGSSGGGARGSVTPGGGDGSEASSQACESAEGRVEEVVDGKMLKGRVQGGGGGRGGWKMKRAGGDECTNNTFIPLPLAPILPPSTRSKLLEGDGVQRGRSHGEQMGVAVVGGGGGGRGGWKRRVEEVVDGKMPKGRVGGGRGGRGGWNTESGGKGWKGNTNVSPIHPSVHLSPPPPPPSINSIKTSGGGWGAKGRRQMGNRKGEKMVDGGTKGRVEGARGKKGGEEMGQERRVGEGGGGKGGWKRRVEEVVDGKILKGRMGGGRGGRGGW